MCKLGKVEPILGPALEEKLMCLLCPLDVADVDDDAWVVLKQLLECLAERYYTDRPVNYIRADCDVKL